MGKKIIKVKASGHNFENLHSLIDYGFCNYIELNGFEPTVILASPTTFHLLKIKTSRYSALSSGFMGNSFELKIREEFIRVVECHRVEENFIEFH